VGYDGKGDFPPFSVSWNSKMNLRKLLFLASCFLLKRAAEFMLLFSVGLAIAIFIGDTEAPSAIWLVLVTFGLTPLLEAAYAIVREEKPND
jgi:hypothetical protein